MPYIYGQLLNSQLENSAGAPSSGGTPVGRVYLDITNAAIGIPRYYDGTAWRVFGNSIATSNTTNTATFNTAGQSEHIYNPTSTVSPLALTFPAVTQIGQILRYSTKNAVTTVNTSFGGTLSIGAALTALSAGQSVAYQAVDTAGTFIRLQ